VKTKGLIYVFCVFFLFQACGRKSAADFNSDFSLFKEFIVSFTGGIVSSESDIRVVLALIKEWKVNEVLDNDLFTISPSVDGKVIALSIIRLLLFLKKAGIGHGISSDFTFG
jgi:hypothetical protein